MKAYEGILEVFQAQGDGIHLIKSDIEEIKGHVVAHTVWRKEIGEGLSQIANIHSLFMGHFSNLSETYFLTCSASSTTCW